MSILISRYAANYFLNVYFSDVFYNKDIIFKAEKMVATEDGAPLDPIQYNNACLLHHAGCMAIDKDK